MLNQVILVGKVEQSVTSEGTFSLEVTNPDGGKDIIPVVLWGGMTKEMTKALRAGSTVGIKARIVNEKGTLVVKAEKMTFINGGE